MLQAEIVKNKNSQVNNIDDINNNKRQVRSQSEKRKCDYNFSYNSNPFNTIDRSKGIEEVENIRDIREMSEKKKEVIERKVVERERQTVERYVPQINIKKHSPEMGYNYRAIVEDVAKIMGVYISNLEQCRT